MKKTPYIFVAYGGSGSTRLCLLLRSQGYQVDARPETVFVPDYFPPYEKTNTKFHQRLGAQGYLEKPQKQSMRGFYKRTGYHLNSKVSIEENLLQYIQKLRQTGRTAMMSRAPMFGFFARNSIPNVLFIVRHPLDMYISLTKKERHQEFVKPLGGINSLRALDFFALEWNSFVGDGVDSSSRVLRYEELLSDGRDLKAIREMSRKWKPKKSSRAVLEDWAKSYLMDRVSERFEFIYGK